jgi:MFS family permease
MAVVAPSDEGLRQRKGAAAPPEPKAELKPSHALMSDEKILERSLMALNLACFADACVGTILGPNYPILMSGKSVHEDAFPDPGIDLTTGMYILQGAPAVSAAIMGLVFAPLSDRIGRKPVVMICLYASVALSVLKYLMRSSFWGFVGASFLNGVFGCIPPVASAYIGDVYSADPAKSEEALGTLMGLQMLGGGLGGVIAILMEDVGMFEPLLAGAPMLFVVALYVHKVLIEPDKGLHDAAADLKKTDNVAAEGDLEAKDKNAKPDALKAPQTLDKKLLFLILFGSLLDNIGSVGMSMALTPVAYTQYAVGPLYVDKEPSLSLEGFKWISTLYIFDLIPGLIAGIVVTQKIGNGGAVVLGNAITAFFMLILLWIGIRMDSNSGNLALFMATFFIGYPMTILSQLTTGPMLDAIAPEKDRGAVQGYNSFVMGIAMSMIPIIFGQVGDAVSDKTSFEILEDYYLYESINGTSTFVGLSDDFQTDKFCLAGEETIMWGCVIFSVLAAFGNLPLYMNPLFGPREPEDKNLVGVSGSDAEIIKKAESGEWVPMAEIERINEERMKAGQPFLRLHYGKYEDEKPRLWKLKEGAESDFKFVKGQMAKYLAVIQDKKQAKALVDMANAARASPAEIKESQRELGAWFTDYLHDNGWWVDDNPALIKEMIMTAFPRCSGPADTLTVDELEPSILNAMRAMNKLVKMQEGDTYSKLLAGKAHPARK